MTARPSLAKSELEVARILWRLGSGTVRQVADELPGNRKLGFKTVQTYLRRLEAKGYFTTRIEGRKRVYEPKVDAERVVKEVIDDLVNRLFDGETMPLLRHLINDQDLSVEEIQQLQKLGNPDSNFPHS